MTKNILSIDVEEIFHIEYARHIKQQHVVYRTPINIQGVLELLDEYNVRATFFIVGEIAEKFPEVVEMLMDKGHEVAFHGWSHLPLWELSPNVFRNEVMRFKGLVPGCVGFRAPSFSLNNDTKWALRVLSEEGFCYDSSVFPAWTPLYGVYEAPRKPYYPSLSDLSKEGNENYGIVEFPLAVLSFLGIRLPVAGGFWLRFVGVNLIREGIERMNKRGLPAVLYVHSWELDFDTPRLKLGPYKSFVTYHNIEKTREILKCLLCKFQFVSFTSYLKEMLS